MNRSDLLSKSGVVGYGIGNKIKAGKNTGILALTVMVERKVPKQLLSKDDLIPEEISGVTTDVIETGKIRAFQARTDKWRPAPGGVSIGHYAITAGTLGAIVKDDTGLQFILSNNHVLANSNDAQIGDLIYQPGPYDGGTKQDVIGALVDFQPITFGGGDSSCPVLNFITSGMNALARLIGSRSRVRGYRTQAETDNVIDAALCLPDDPAFVADHILEIGPVMGVNRELKLGDAVIKSGRTTGVMSSTVSMVDATVNVSYGTGKIAIFIGQYVAGAMSQGGDSGSLVLDANNKAAGLLFAGSDDVTIFNPIGSVLDILKVNF